MRTESRRTHPRSTLPKSERIVIDDVLPVVSRGKSPSKAVVGEHVPLSATVWREGHDAVGATAAWRGPKDRGWRRTRMTAGAPGQDQVVTTIVPDQVGLWSFKIEAWSDPWTTWRSAVTAKVADGQDADALANDLELGARLLDRAARRPGVTYKPMLTEAAAALRDTGLPLAERIRLALDEPVSSALYDNPIRDLLTTGAPHHIWVDRDRAAFGSWYEFFPRSTGGVDENGAPVHGTFATAERALDRVAAMGFDVVYLPPIHPIGAVNRKGRNNSVHAEPGDVGSPWAIGSADGGHDAVHPDLGTLVDFKSFVARADELGMEVALDLALQCAPDHPWVAEHPEWFTTLPDGTIAYAENPPKKYQDIYPLDFDTAPATLYAEILEVVTGWIERGVRIFRVDNPHTKPPDFWHWLIARVKRTYPDVLFLAEAFTRPARLHGLARLGFTQSYTYFTWRTGKRELIEFGEDLVAHADETRPNLFVNTPDILHESLQHGGPAMFAIRATLAATLAPTWGVYSGFELYEHEAVREGSEEYLDSEKYELRPRDFEGALARHRSLEPWLGALNAIRRAHPALQQLRTLRFHDLDDDSLLAYSKVDPATGDTVVVIVTLDPHQPHEGTLRLPLADLGLPDRFAVVDLVSGQRWQWSDTNYVRLDPRRAVAHIVSIPRRTHGH
ncbi:alpha-1,4-glucan:maltose-1-phosphate maltosyltransferase [Actinokineospora alba]|uniref:Alpha-1,4-glucan:maltose-1-phosphate maltosyltransferase n=1 Tax=Actinokineospora alba TaxID=504798 RepID=A0A1H0TRZ5_9PSEU|nr:alpha-1,4-glucan--maltose-1-phosphate maltosyltransferase [Actinokineospora alba]TDP70672.1 alpha-1,4-glucan:maltose-1-phosphate maltosyltransferase [Actinokineospora alba]SDJ13293.1 starch synthase (maltosyl-transferring) [Actinokineospora alba]SDP56575.1 alpha-1,4-glucan:maltose-1-phosphate maltosyltransferase [Actinokineospora alba]